MIADTHVRLATQLDAADIAAMSRDYIEQGFRWRWTYDRVMQAIANPDTNVAVVGKHGALIAFGIMSYVGDDAHLLLIAVRRSSQRKGIGSAILLWLEQVAYLAGIKRILVEARSSNSVAHSFYNAHDYHKYLAMEEMYFDIEPGIGLVKRLRNDD
jgi:ribosomal protein S18 acetylase RimI-like enzyme